MTRSVLLTSALVCVVTGPAAAKQPGEEAYIIRMLACEGPDARMEVYIPQSIATNDAALARGLARSVIGYYTLDLTGPTKASCSNRSRSRSRPTSRRSSSTSIRASCRRRAFRSAAAPSISIIASAAAPNAAPPGHRNRPILRVAGQALARLLRRTGSGVPTLRPTWIASRPSDVRRTRAVGVEGIVSKQRDRPCRSVRWAG
jgi:hypothetical protein